MKIIYKKMLPYVRNKMIETRIRPFIQPLFTISAHYLSKNFSATTVTAFSFICGIAAAFCIGFNFTIYACRIFTSFRPIRYS